MNHSATLFAIILLLTSCAKDEGPLYIPLPRPPGEPIDTAYFSTEVLPILTTKCWTCHPPTAGLDLSAEMAYDDLVGMVSINYSPGIRVVPGDPEASVLWHKINFTEVYGLGMPPNGSALAPEELATIRDWIQQGALDN
jgi:hypothetical protein